MAGIKVPPQPELAKHDSSILDLAFAMDCTASMGSYIREAQQSIRCIVEEIVSAEKSDIRLALVEYRDHPPEEQTFVTRVNDFTKSVSKMKGWLDNCAAVGGGDEPEAVADALQQVLKLSWRDEATKICVFIADAPPHGLGGSSDNMPNGCPDGLDPMQITNALAEKGVTIYMVGCEPSITRYKDFFMAIAHITGGQYVPLGNAKLLPKVIIGGAQEEISLQQLMVEVNQEVLQQAAVGGGEVDEEEVSKALHEKLRVKGIKTKKLTRNNASLPEASAKAKELSAQCSMADVRNCYKVSSAEPMPTGGFFGRAFAAPPMGMGMCVADSALDEEADGALGAPPLEAQCAPAAESYNVLEDVITYDQASRMVQKSMMAHKVMKKKK